MMIMITVTVTVTVPVTRPGGPPAGLRRVGLGSVLTLPATHWHWHAARGGSGLITAHESYESADGGTSVFGRLGSRVYRSVPPARYKALRQMSAASFCMEKRAQYKHSRTSVHLCTE
eukprot:2397095-Rhodomonas_salina.2